MKLQNHDPLKHEPDKSIPEIQPPVIIPDNPPVAPPDNPPATPPEIIPGREPGSPSNPPEISPTRSKTDL